MRKAKGDTMIAVLMTVRRILRTLREIFPPSELGKDRFIDQAYWAIGHRRNEIERRQREARRLIRMQPKNASK